MLKIINFSAEIHKFQTWKFKAWCISLLVFFRWISFSEVEKFFFGFKYFSFEFSEFSNVIFRFLVTKFNFWWKNSSFFWFERQSFKRLFHWNHCNRFQIYCWHSFLTSVFNFFCIFMNFENISFSLSFIGNII